MLFVGLVKSAFSVAFLDALGQKILNLPVYGAKIIICPGGKPCI